ncbi:flavin-containing monooxygenase [Streptomyces sp. INA 01156]
MAALLRQPHAVLGHPVQLSAGDAVPRADRNHYPHRDEVVAYLTAYASRLDAEIRTGCRVSAVRRTGDAFEVELEGGGRLSARAVVAASGSFGRPHRQALPGLEEFTGQVLHAADYRNPAPFTGRRVVVVGRELGGADRRRARRGRARHARHPRAGEVRDAENPRTRPALLADPHRPGHRTPWALPRPPAQPVLDDGRYRTALAAGRPERRPLFTGADGAKLVWPNGEREEVDAVVLATGYRPDLPYLAPLGGALDADGNPQHREGLAVGAPGLAFVGLEWQRSLSSNSLRGVGRDADRIARRLAAHLARS